MPRGDLADTLSLVAEATVRENRCRMQSRTSTMRTSDAERQRVADFLRDACGEGRLSPEELEERLDQLFAGSTVADIAVLVRDLPRGSAGIPRLRRAAPARPIARPPGPPRRPPGPSPPVSRRLAPLAGR